MLVVLHACESPPVAVRIHRSQREKAKLLESSNWAAEGKGYLTQDVLLGEYFLVVTQDHFELH